MKFRNAPPRHLIAAMLLGYFGEGRTQELLDRVALILDDEEKDPFEGEGARVALASMGTSNARCDNAALAYARAYDAPGVTVERIREADQKALDALLRWGRVLRERLERA